MNSKIPLISFTSKIKFVTKSEFDALPTKKMDKEGKNVADPWTIDEVIIKDEGFTKDIYSCNAGGITNNDQLLLFHLHPQKALNNLIDTMNQLRNKVNSFKQKEDNLKGLIIGGNQKFHNSKELFSYLKTFFGLMNAKTSIIWGQKDVRDYINIHYSVKNDTWTINAQTTNDKKETESISTPEQLIKHFDIIDISEDDEVFFNNNKIDKNLFKYKKFAHYHRQTKPLSLDSLMKVFKDFLKS